MYDEDSYRVREVERLREVRDEKNFRKYNAEEPMRVDCELV